MERRDALKLMGAVGLGVVLGCGSENRQKEREITRIKKEIGNWSDEEVLFLARGMQKEEGLTSIQHAGNILVDNTLNKPSFSKMGPFSDEVVRISTVGNLRSLGTNEKIDLMTFPRIKAERPNINVTLVRKDTNESRNFNLCPGLRLEEIQINDRLINNYSDLILKFQIAKNLYIPKAADLFAQSVINASFGAIYRQLTNPKELKALKADAIASNVKAGGVPADFMVDSWAHFLLVPDYLKTKERNNFLNNELNSSPLRVLELTSNAFLEKGIVRKTGEGIGWIDDKEGILIEYFLLSQALFNAFKPTESASTIT